MSVPSHLRSCKRIAMRQAISHTATGLFIERGFDHVTVDKGTIGLKAAMAGSPYG